jgi:nitrogen fixation protein FixH
LLPSFRPFQAVEATLLVVAAAVVDAVTDNLTGTHVLLILLTGAAVVAVVGHLIAVLASERLR